MFEILIKRFLKAIVLMLLLVVMFALAFYMTFNQFNPLFQRSPFATPLNSIWKTMTMMTGEMDYEDIFRQSSGGTVDQVPELPFLAISYVLWILFLILMPVLLSNMLVKININFMHVVCDFMIL